MRIYPTYHLLRLIDQRVIRTVSIMMLLLAVAFSSLAASKISYADSVYYSLSKKERLSKLLILPIKDFNKKDELSRGNQIIKYNNIGGVIINNGDQKEVQKWINQLRTESFPARPFFALKMNRLLGSGLEGIQKFPALNQIELLSDDSLIFDIGYAYGKALKHIGMDMIIIDSMKTASVGKVNNYVNGVQSAGVEVVINNLLNLKGNREEKNPDGLVIEKPQYDQENLVSKCFMSFENGSDMVVLPEDIKLSYSLLSMLYSVKPPKKKLLKAKGKRVIEFKRRLSNLEKNSLDIEAEETGVLYDKTLLGSIVLIKNEKDIFPLIGLDEHNFALISNDLNFSNYMDQYARIAHYDFNYFGQHITDAIEKLSRFDVVFANISTVDDAKSTIHYLRQINKKSNVVIVYSGDQNGLKKFKEFSTVVWTPKNDGSNTSLIPQVIFGAREMSGELTMLNDKNDLTIFGEYVAATGRFKFPTEGEFLVHTDSLFKIDILVRDAIQAEVFPGCQIFMAKGGTVVYNKAFGHLTYDSLIHVDNNTIYDIASITKVVGTVPSLMFLNDWNKVSVDDTLGFFLPEYANSDKSHIPIEDLLTHQSGFRSYLPFWRNAEFDSEVDDFRFKLPRKKRYKYISQTINWNDSIESWIAKSRFNSLLQEDGSYKYLYSDLGFMALKNLTESQINQPIDIFLHQNLFAPMGMNSTGYLPLCQFPADRIAPTEEDNHLRNELVWGKVHDRNAALIGGVSGHAGLFSNASDLGKYMQMVLQEGYYGGKRYFSEQTVKRFISKPHSSSRRALGWDKPDSTIQNASQYTSAEAFGHSGFTGTLVWADPSHDLVYVFLSNRVYPDAQNNKLIQSNIRTRIHDIMYESLLTNK